MINVILRKRKNNYIGYILVEKTKVYCNMDENPIVLMETLCAIAKTM